MLPMLSCGQVVGELSRPCTITGTHGKFPLTVLRGQRLFIFTEMLRVSFK